MILTDCHMHSSWSGDSDAPMEDMILSSIGRGLKTICFTEHNDPDYFDSECDFNLDTAGYMKGILPLKEKYRDRIEILFGMEFGFQSHLLSYYNDYINSWPFDFIIGSAHLMYGEDPYDKKVVDRYNDPDLYRRYFECILEDVTMFDNFQSFGHLDYIVRYGHHQEKEYHPSDLSDLIDEILKTLIRKNIALECNSAGLKYGLSFAHPHPDILRRYRELGGELLTIGADAHAPEHIAYDFDKLPGMLKECGFNYYAVYRNRKPEFLPL